VHHLQGKWCARNDLYSEIKLVIVMNNSFLVLSFFSKFNPFQNFIVTLGRAGQWQPGRSRRIWPELNLGRWN